MSTPVLVAGGIVIIIVVIMAIAIFANSTQVVPQEKRLAIRRFGRFNRVAGPGLVTVIPILDQVDRVIEVRNHPVGITVPGIFVFGFPNDLTLNFWHRFDPVQATGGNRDKLANFLQITGGERNHQVEVKIREALVNQVIDLQKQMPLNDTSALAGVAALAPGAPRYNKLLEKIQQQLNTTLPSLGIILDDTQPIVLTRRSISDEILEAIKRRRGREIDSEWLTNYADKLRKQFPEMSETVLTQMLASVEGVNMALLSEEIISHFQNPYIAGPPIVDPKMFFGRQSDLNKIIASLTNNFVMVTGPRRIGKTSLLHQLAYHLPQLKNTLEKFLPVLVNVEGTLEVEFFHLIMEEIVDVAREYFPTKSITNLSFDISDPTYGYRIFNRDLRIVLKNLQNTTPRPSRLVLLLDEMDMLNNYNLETQSKLRHVFQNFVNRNLSVVVAGVRLHQHWAGETSPFYNMFMPITLTPFTQTEARRLITEPVKGLYNYNEEAMTHILEATLGLPHRIQQLCLEIIHHLQTASEERTEIMPEDVDAVLQTIHWLDEESVEPDEEGIPLVTEQSPVIAEKKADYQIEPDDKETV